MKIVSEDCRKMMHPQSKKKNTEKIIMDFLFMYLTYVSPIIPPLDNDDNDDVDDIDDF